MKNLIGLKELRENVDTYVSEVQKGKSFIVMRRSRPIFRITPPDDADELWETVIDFTEFYKDGIPARQLLKKLRSLNERPR
ncbi:MAG: type II toxin-antitoxin system prevent-host-death family antitoxin [Candidatus Sungiibacteriota bacterium]